MGAVMDTYKYAELDDDAKRKAREWFGDCVREDWEPELGSISEVLGKLGFAVDKHPVKLMNGKARLDPLIHYSLAYCQGDGASFEGRWCADSMHTGELLEEWPEDGVLKGIIAALMAVFLQYPGATCRVDTSDAGSAVRINEARRWDGDDPDDEATDTLCAVLKRIVEWIGDWIYNGMREEYEYQTSDEACEEGIEANDYSFDEDGRRQ